MDHASPLLRWLLPASLLLAPAPAAAQAGEIAQFQQRQALRFNSAGHRKANGLEISLAYPRTWRAGEGERPHIVQTFVATGDALSCNLLVRDAGEPVSEAEARTFLRPANILSLLPDNAERATAQPTRIDGLTAVEMIYETAVHQGRLARSVKTVQFVTVWGRSFIQLTCGLGALDRAQALARFAAYLPLFRLIANSIVVHDRWREAR
jgi:hypothetical protein